MIFFRREEPGVEWRQDFDEVTLPINPATALDRTPTVCPACGGDVGIDGYCQQCGQKARSMRDHFEVVPAPWVAGVCDIGQMHARNEDALACQADEDRAVIVVCDGVTTSDDADVASLAAAQAACVWLWEHDPQGIGLPGSRQAAIQSALTQAVAAANQAVIANSDPSSVNSAASTIAAAVVADKTIHAANLGDSRIYWLPDDGEPSQMTKDHSLAQAGMDSGAGRAEAESSIYAHTITKWLGRDATDLEPNLASLPVDGPGWLIVCSDGLWNYASEADDIRAAVTRCAEANASPEDLARCLVTWANDHGGHDNITVACARLGTPTPVAEAPAEPVAETPAEPVAEVPPAEVQAEPVAEVPPAEAPQENAPAPEPPLLGNIAIADEAPSQDVLQTQPDTAPEPGQSR